MKIIRLLQEDSRKSFRNLADELGIAVGTAYNRVKNLEATGVLKKYTTLVDPTRLGYSLTAIILVHAEGKHLSEVEKEIAQLADTICVYDITGDFDMAVIARFKSRDMLDKFIKGILRTSHVIRTVTNVALNVIKEDFRVQI